ncbi:carboxypeptidase S [Peniophora sp. CONT]|nr:carboxypeptidase S [Peniophora sp. CONT]
MAPAKKGAVNYLPTKFEEQPSLEPPRKPSRLYFAAKVTLCILATCFYFSDEIWSLRPGLQAVSVSVSASQLCPQVEPITSTAQDSLVEALDAYLLSAEGSGWAIESLAGAVRVPTQTFDDIKAPGEDSRWDIFQDLHDFFGERFPLVHSELEVNKINQWGLVYRWQGSDESLKPLVFAAHLDVVPVNPETEDEWIHHPFSGFYDGDHIWGRGSCDDKAQLVGTIAAVELLLHKGYKPTRSIVLAYGFDEERGGQHGAQHISKFLLDTYGKDGVALIVDEGGEYDIRDNVVIAAPSVAEKGATNINVEVTTPGGHSSVPPTHTGIGYLARVVAALEDHPYPTSLKRDGTYFRSLQCAAAYDDSLPDDLRELIAVASTDDDALVEAEKALLERDERTFRAYAGTTQAVDIIHGGVKSNALPERAYAIVNHRIAEYSTVPETRARYAKILAPLATKLNLTLDTFGTLHGSGGPAKGHIIVSDGGYGLEPAPVSPTDGSGAWKLLSGTILSSLGTSSRAELTDKRVIVAPGIMVANSDTKWYWDLTKNIFRYNHIGVTDRFNGLHTVNEAVKAEGYIEGIRFYARLILNVDETDLI